MRTLYPDQFEVYSAGIAPAGIHPPAIWTMKEIGIDITRQRSKSFRDFCNWHFDDGVTFSSEVHDALGITTPKARVYLNRPVKTHSDVYENEKAALADFRKLRDKLQEILVHTFGEASNLSESDKYRVSAFHNPDP
jgi:arsenate reductase